MRIGSCILILSIFTASPAPAGAQDRVLSFKSYVAVQRDGSLEVIETIKVQVSENIAKSGFIRDLIVSEKSEDHSISSIPGFSLHSVTMDGRPQTVTIAIGATSGYRLIVKDRSKTPRTGVTTYVLRYKTERPLHRFSDRDELYWHVTGYGWTIPAAHASIEIKGPPGAKLARGEAIRTCAGLCPIQQALSSQRFKASTDVALTPDTDFVAIVSWPKGWIRPSKTSDIRIDFK